MANLHIPENGGPKTHRRSLSHEESMAYLSISTSDYDIQPKEEDAETLVGFAIGREQTRYTMPSTPAAERMMAFDAPGYWGTMPSSMPPSPTTSAPTPKQFIESTNDRASRAPEHCDDISDDEDDMSVRADPGSDEDRAETFSPLSPFAEATTGIQITKELVDSEEPVTGVSRDQSAGPNRPRKFSIKLPNSLHGIFGGTTSPKGSRSRATSISTAPQSARTLVSSPSPKLTESPSQTSSETNVSATTSQTQQSSFKGHSRNASDVNLNTNRPQNIRRVSSVGSIGDYRVSMASFGEDPEFINHSSQVNTRFKAIVDQLHDAKVKLPSANLDMIKLPTFLKSLSEDKSSAQTLPGLSPAPKHRRKKTRYKVLQEALEGLTGDIVLLGGYRGSILRSAEPPHRQLWVPIKVGLGMRKVDLEVGLNREDEERMEETIFPSGMLTHVGPFDISKRLFKKLRSCENVAEGKLRVHDWGYDWRLSPDLLRRKLIEFLEKLPSNQPGVPASERGATVIAHSLGGLITRSAVNARPELFAGVIYAGTPRHTVNILGPLRNGDDVLLSSKVLTAQVNFTLRTSFLLLPESGRCFYNPETKEEYPVDFFDIQTWKQNALSPCIEACDPVPEPEPKHGLLESLTNSIPGLKDKDTHSDTNIVDEAEATAEKVANPESTALGMSMSPPPNPPTKEDMKTQASDPSPPADPSAPPTHPSNPLPSIPHPIAAAYLERTLNETMAFKRTLSHNPNTENANLYPPFGIIYGTTIPTVYGAKVSSREAIRRADAYDNLAFASGDGVVLAAAAKLPKGYKYADGGKVLTERGHVGLLGDLDAVGKAIIAIVSARKQGVGCGGVDVSNESVVGRQEGVKIESTDYATHGEDGQNGNWV